jgi:hypothetical protein
MSLSCYASFPDKCFFPDDEWASAEIGIHVVFLGWQYSIYMHLIAR